MIPQTPETHSRVRDGKHYAGGSGVDTDQLDTDQLTNTGDGMDAEQRRRLELELTLVRKQTEIARLEVRAAQIELMLRDGVSQDDVISRVRPNDLEVDSSRASALDALPLNSRADASRIDLGHVATSAVPPTTLSAAPVESPPNDTAGSDAVGSGDNLQGWQSLATAIRARRMARRSMVSTNVATPLQEHHDGAAPPHAVPFEMDKPQQSSNEEAVVDDSMTDDANIATDEDASQQARSHTLVVTDDVEPIRPSVISAPDAATISASPSVVISPIESDTQPAPAMTDPAEVPELDFEGQHSTTDDSVRRRGPMVMIVSTLAHVAVLLVLGLFTLASPTNGDAIALSASTATPTEDVQTFEIQSQQEMPETTQTEMTATQVNMDSVTELMTPTDFAGDIVSETSDFLQSSMSSDAAALQSALSSSSTATDNQSSFCGVTGGG
ncbi:MAG: hypothetical protein AAFP69_14555, partial [Planctomycetota bacterium]